MKTLGQTFRRLGSCEGGATAVEFALIGTLLVAGTLIAIDFGRAYYFYNRMSNAIEQTARNSLVFSSANDQLISEINKYFPAASGKTYPSEGVPKVTVTDGTGFRTVKVEMIFKPIVPTFVEDTINMTLERRLPKAS